MSRLLGRSVRDLAEEVDNALGRLASARGLEAVAQDTLRLAQADVAKAEAEVAAARDALFEEHPDLRPSTWSPVSDFQPQEASVSATPAPLSGDLEGHLDPSKFEAIEVDDSDDPRWTSGAAPVVSPSEDDDLPPIVWGEHDE